MIRRTSFPGRQRGMAALLLVLLAGMSLSALTLGTMYYVNGSQHSSQSVHARTQAEISAWAGVEALRQFLAGKSAAEAAALQAATIQTTDGQRLARVEYLAACSRSGQPCYAVTGYSADSTVVLEAGFAIGGGGAYERLDKGVMINGDFRASGDALEVLGGAVLSDMAVDGDIDITSTSPVTLSSCATGNIRVGPMSSFGGSLRAQGDICVDQTQAEDVSLWGNSVMVGRAGGRYRDVRFRCFLSSSNQQFAAVQGGGADEASCPGSARGKDKAPGSGHWFIDKKNPPQLSGEARIAGQVYDIAGQDAGSCVAGGFAAKPKVANPHGETVAGVQTRVAGVDPGVPPCQTRRVTHDANSLEDQANYVFYFDAQNDNRPTLKIQHLRLRQNGQLREVAGSYDLTRTDVVTLPGGVALPFISCWGSSCRFGDSNPRTGWGRLEGLRLPPGIVLFKGRTGVNADVTISSADEVLYNGLLSGGSLTLLPAARNELRAPNFAGGRDGATTPVCDGALFPSQLCDDSGHLQSWQDGDTLRRGVPLGNLAVLSNHDLLPNGWQIHGNVLVGRTLSGSGERVRIYGALLIGDRSGLQHAVSNGSLTVDLRALLPEQIFIPQPGSSGGSGGNGGSGGTGGVKLLRVRTL